MNTWIFEASLSNVAFAAALALIAAIVDRRFQLPQLSHALWLLVLIKLVTPPLLGIPVDFSFLSEPAVAVEPAVSALTAAYTVVAAVETNSIAPSLRWELMLGYAWIPGSIIYLGVSLTRIIRFNRLLQASESPVPASIKTLNEKLSAQLALKRPPKICVTEARITPMIWSWLGQPKLYLPKQLTADMPLHELNWVIAHELAHVRRGDHAVRWLEWFARILFWWNPLVWLAGRSLRAAEEICCDQLVQSAFHPQPGEYALSIVKAIRTLIHPIQVPSMASRINGSESLERRVKMMMTDKIPMTRTIKTMLIALVALMPFGMLSAETEPDYSGVQRRLDAAVVAGEITQEEAQVRWDAFLRRADNDDSHQDPDQTNRLEAAAHEIQMAVNAGRITQAQADERLKSMRQHIAQQHELRRGIEERMVHIRQAVSDGSMTEEEARRAMADMREHMARAGQERNMNRRLREQELRKNIEIRMGQVRQAVSEGSMTEEQGQRAMADMREHMARAGQERSMNRRLAEQELRKNIEIRMGQIRQAVSEGRMTEERGQRAIADTRQHMAHASKERAMNQQVEEFSRQIEHGLSTGAITEEQAEQRRRAFRAQMAQAGQRE